MAKSNTNWIMLVVIGFGILYLTNQGPFSSTTNSTETVNVEGCFIPSTTVYIETPGKYMLNDIPFDVFITPNIFDAEPGGTIKQLNAEGEMIKKWEVSCSDQMHIHGYTLYVPSNTTYRSRETDTISNYTGLDIFDTDFDLDI